jgi:putative ABC transport system permease protein
MAPSDFRLLISRITGLFANRRRDAELADEIQAHLDSLAEDHVRRGMSVDEARRAARRDFGGLEQMKEQYRAQRGLPWIDTLAQDGRYAFRMFRKHRWFTAIAVLTLALGIGANTAIFTLIHRVLLQTLPVRSPEQLLELSCVIPGDPDLVRCETSYPGFQIYRANNTLFEGLFAFAAPGPLNLNDQSEAAPATGLLASGEMYSVLGVVPGAGRLFDAREDQLASPLVIVLSDSYWRRRFGGDPAVIGRAVRLNNIGATIVGVTPREFRGLEVGTTPDVMLPMAPAAELLLGNGKLEREWEWWVRVIGRRKDGVSLEAVEAALEPLFQKTREQFVAALPAESARAFSTILVDSHFRARPAAAGAASDFRHDLDRPLRILMGGVGLVLLISCANLASLLLARADGRQLEFGIRLALGASQARLARQLLTEALLLSAIGGALGVIAARWGSSVFLRLASGEIGVRAVDVSVDVPVLLFTGVTTLLVSVLIGLGPVFGAAPVNPQIALHGAKGSGSPSRLGGWLVPGQVALATILMVGAGLFVRTFSALRDVDLGFRTSKLVTLTVSPALAGHDDARSRAYLKDLLRRLDTVTAVRSAAISSDGPAGLLIWFVAVDGFQADTPEARAVGRKRVGSRFVETAGLTLLEGRDFDRNDDERPARIAIVNESFAKHFFPKRDAVGRRFAFLSQTQAPYTIVGVVADARERGPKNPTERVVYTLSAQETPGEAILMVRSDDPEQAVIGSLRSLLREVDADVPVRDIRSMDQQIGDMLGRERLLAMLGSAFGSVALLLSAIGLYGLLAGAVTRRTNEIGLRMALGARQASVLWQFLSDGLRLVFLGLIAGLAGSLFVTRFLESQLFGVKPIDPATLITAAGILLAVTFVATLIPAQRAARVDPMVALRHE